MAETGDWTLSRYTDTDAAASLDLVRRTWGDIEAADASYQRWQYVANPAGSAVAAVAQETASGRIIGQIVKIRSRVSLEGQELPAGLCLNVATDPQWRGRGIFTRLLDAVIEACADEGMLFTFGFPNPQSHPMFTKRVYTDIGAPSLLVRPASIERLVRKRFGSRILSKLAAPLGLLWRTPRPMSGTDPNVEIVRVERFDDSFDAFWQRVKGRHPVMVVRDAVYLNWRFADAPTRQYVTFAARSKDGIEGFIVLRVGPVSVFTAGLIVDFIVAPGEAGLATGRRLIDRAYAYFRDFKLDLLGSLSLSHTVEFKLLREKGLWVCPKRLEPQPFPMIVRTYDEKTRIAYDLKNWFVTMGDYDAV